MYLKNSASRCRVAKVLEMTKALTWKFVQVADDIVVYLPSLYTVINEVNDDEDDHRRNKRNERSELITNITEDDNVCSFDNKSINIFFL